MTELDSFASRFAALSKMHVELSKYRINKKVEFCPNSDNGKRYTDMDPEYQFTWTLFDESMKCNIKGVDVNMHCKIWADTNVDVTVTLGITLIVCIPCRSCRRC